MRLADKFPADTRAGDRPQDGPCCFTAIPTESTSATAPMPRNSIRRDRKELGVRKGELYYLILYPRDLTSEHPLNSELDDYNRWFEGVKLKYDIPGKGLIQGS